MNSPVGNESTFGKNRTPEIWMFDWQRCLQANPNNLLKKRFPFMKSHVQRCQNTKILYGVIDFVFNIYIITSIFLSFQSIVGEVVKNKPNSCGHAGRGWVQPPVRNLIGFFFLKEKKMQNVLKRKNMNLEGFQVILNFFPQNHTF